MKKLYICTVSLDVAVMAENITEAEKLVIYHAKDELSNGFALSLGNEIEDISQLPKEWQDSIPYNGDDDKTCSQILDI